MYMYQQEICFILKRPFCFVRLSHPNIVQLLDVFDDKAHVYLVMELYVFHSHVTTTYNPKSVLMFSLDAWLPDL